MCNRLPVCPVKPICPGEPGVPGVPVHPWGPDKPIGPCGPGDPGVPLGPGGPVDPTAYQIQQLQCKCFALKTVTKITNIYEFIFRKPGRKKNFEIGNGIRGRQKR